MENMQEKIICIKNFSFTYPNEKTPALIIDNFDVKCGEFLLIMGNSGCGKTTMLRNLKPLISPGGIQKGEIFFDGKELLSLPEYEQVKKIGFVFQNPEKQVVTNTVYRELQFTLDNLGVELAVSQKRIAELVTYFGIENIIDKETNSLSIGQIQIVNLVAVMLTNPSILLLDEPLSSLDPVFSQKIIDMLYRINQELGTTIILSEHKSKQIIPNVDRICILDNGHIVAEGNVDKISEYLVKSNNPLFSSMPVSIQLYESFGGQGKRPITVNEGRAWLKATPQIMEKVKIEDENREKRKKDFGIICKRICFFYDDHRKKILNDISFEIEKGSIVAVLGGNGAGKTTLLRLIAKKEKILSGKVITRGECMFMPSNVKYMFSESTVMQELDSQDNELLVKYHLEKYANRNPFDLSFGESIRLGIALMEKNNPDIFLMDEPTRGLDEEFKKELKRNFKELGCCGKTIVFTSHDLDFVSVVADKVIFLFGGEIIYEGDKRGFFSSNLFYTTSLVQITRGRMKSAINMEDLVYVEKAN